MLILMSIGKLLLNVSVQLNAIYEKKNNKNKYNSHLNKLKDIYELAMIFLQINRHVRFEICVSG